jgi:hypothetical protein
VTRTLSAAILLGCAFLAPAHASESLFQPDLRTLAAVPRVELPLPAVRKALTHEVKGRPFQFAVPVDLPLSARQGVWQVDGDTARWRLRVRSAGARSLSLKFERPALPAGSTLWIYDPRADLVHGPYDATRISPTGLWTPAVAGEELVVELRVPAARADQADPGPAKAYHGFRAWEAQPKAAGDCHVDVTCPQASDWTAEAGSVARISIGNAFLCSGQLLNNVRQDQRRLFITANHCGVDGASGPADSVVFYFNYEGPCGDGVSNTLPAPTFQGALRLAQDVQSDFTLMVITDTRPLPDGLYFAGWDATGGDNGSSGAAIHHPAGDEKKIAFHTTSPQKGTVNIGAGCPVDAWSVQWSSGTTEAGSSGGGLWNASHRLIGVLSGGTASCDNTGGTDYFARLDRGWTAGPGVEQQLKAHLDPDNTCIAVVPGLDPVANPSPGAVQATDGNVVCEGLSSSCTGGRGGGGVLGTLSLLVLAGFAARRRAL